MNETLIKRIQGLAAAGVAVSYFLPWVSIMSPLGSVELKGLYLDYAWVLLLLAVTHLCGQLVHAHLAALGIPETYEPHIKRFQRFAPLVLLGMIVWYGTWFEFSARQVGKNVAFGVQLEQFVKAGLDYGFWLAIVAAFVLVLSGALVAKDLRKSALVTTVLVLGVSGASFALSHLTDTARGHSVQVPSQTASQTIDGNTPSAATQPEQPAPDYSAILTVSSVSGHIYSKNYEASRYSDSVVITAVFKNVGAKTIVGIRGTITVLDGFGREAFAFNFRDDDKLRPGSESRRAGGWQFEDNQFVNDEPYDKLYPLVSAETAKYKVVIREIAFDDGTALPTK